MVKHFPPKNAALRGKLSVAARRMRHEATPAEDFLWQRLRGRQLGGYKFHRQHQIDRFIVDFYCASAALIIEVDGEVHQQQVDADKEREQCLNSLGFRVIRFSNTQILLDIDQVLWDILTAIKDTPSPKPGFDGFGEGAGG